MRWLERWRRPRVRLQRMAYVSMVAPHTSMQDVETLVAGAEVTNQERGIFGVLVFNGQNFMQIVEGPDEAIQHLTRRLRTDPRHYNMAIQFDQAVANRCFEEWRLQLIVPFQRQPPAMPATLEPPLQRLWSAFCTLG